MNTIEKVLAYMVIDQIGQRYDPKILREKSVVLYCKNIYSFNSNITVIMLIYSSRIAPTIVSYYSQIEESKMFNLVSNK